MNFEFMHRAYEVGLPLAKKSILMAMASFCQKDGSDCHPSISTLCRMTGAGRRTAQEKIRELEKEGIAVRAISNPGTTINYTIILPTATGAYGAHGASRAHGALTAQRATHVRGGRAWRAGGARHAPRGGAPRAPELRSKATEVKKKANSAAAPKLSHKPWEMIGSSVPIGTPEFREHWEACFRSHDGQLLSETMERCIRQRQESGRKVPPPFFTAKRKVEAKEKAKALATVPSGMMTAAQIARERERDRAR
jgi:hypothetical protein